MTEHRQPAKQTKRHASRQRATYTETGRHKHRHGQIQRQTDSMTDKSFQATASETWCSDLAGNNKNNKPTGRGKFSV